MACPSHHAQVDSQTRPTLDTDPDLRTQSTLSTAADTDISLCRCRKAGNKGCTALIGLRSGSLIELTIDTKHRTTFKSSIASRAAAAAAESPEDTTESPEQVEQDDNDNANAAVQAQKAVAPRVKIAVKHLARAAAAGAEIWGLAAHPDGLHYATAADDGQCII